MDVVNASEATASPVNSTANVNIIRAPWRSSSGPNIGDKTAAMTPASETAPEIAVLDQPNSFVIGSTNMESVATAGPCLANPAQQAANSTTHP